MQKQNDADALSKVWDLKNSNPNPAITSLPASTWAYLKSRGLDEKVTAILNGHPAADDPALFNQLHRLASEDPVKFASLVTPRMKQSHKNSVIKLTPTPPNMAA